MKITWFAAVLASGCCVGSLASWQKKSQRSINCCLLKVSTKGFEVILFCLHRVHAK